MFSAKIENSAGQMMTLTGKEADFQVLSITGLEPPKAQINVTTIYGLDGALFNSSKLDTRNIVILLKINGDVDNNRMKVYDYFRTKEKCKFYFKNDVRNVTIEGYIESVECSLFSQAEMAQISIICPLPYFKSFTELLADTSDSEGLFELPFSINADDPVVISEIISSYLIACPNDSDSETPCEVHISVLKDCGKIEMKNASTGEDFTVIHAFEAGDDIIIDTTKGQKSITLIRDGETSSIFSSITAGSTFFQLIPGLNAFDYLIDDHTNDDDVFIEIRYFLSYRGV